MVVQAIGRTVCERHFGECIGREQTVTADIVDLSGVMTVVEVEVAVCSLLILLPHPQHGVAGGKAVALGWSRQWLCCSVLRLQEQEETKEAEVAMTVAVAAITQGKARVHREMALALALALAWALALALAWALALARASQEMAWWRREMAWTWAWAC